MGSVYTPGQYDVVELKNRLDAIEYGLTQRVLESGPIKMCIRDRYGMALKLYLLPYGKV